MVGELAHMLTTITYFIRIHRDAHARRLLEEACRMVLDVGRFASVLSRFTLALANLADQIQSQPDHDSAFYTG